MRVIFLSEIPCALTVGGAYLGLIDKFERSVELDPAANFYCSVAPLGDFLPVGFVFDEKFLFDPPPQVKLYHAREFVSVYVGGFFHADRSLHVLRQDRINGALLTLVMQGKLQLYFEYGTTKILDLPDSLSDCTPSAVPNGFLLRASGVFALISLDGELLLCQEGTILEEGNPLRAEIPFHDCMGHTAVCEWTDGKLTACSIRSGNPPTENTLALAIFESVLIGADPKPFLDEKLLPKADALKSYLGDFCSVVLTDEKDKVGLVYERRARVFDVRYFRVEINAEKVCNIVPI